MSSAAESGGGRATGSAREGAGPPGYRLTGVVPDAPDAPDARESARCYQRPLGWEALDDEPDGVRLAPPGGGTGLSFQSERASVPPCRPSGPATGDGSR